jgi:putative (di)nucleoside polyphosphate hydrolase
MKDVYRSCASVAVFRKNGEQIEMLLVHKPRKKDAWQLPQGGVEEGESTQEAAAREIMEEAGIAPEIFGSSDHVYTYDFPASYRRFRPDNVCGQTVEYFFGELPMGVDVTVDQEEIDSFTWVTRKKIPKYLKRKAYLKLAMNLYDDGVALLP